MPPHSMPDGPFVSHYGTRVPNVYFDRVLPHLSGAEAKVMGYLFHITYGQGRQWAPASTRDFVEGAGLAPATVTKALGELLRVGLIAMRPGQRDHLGYPRKWYRTRITNDDHYLGSYPGRAPRKRKKQKIRRLSYSDAAQVQGINTRAAARGCAGKVTVREWRAIKEHWDHCCARCGLSEYYVVLTLDHVTPLALGGANVAANIVPLCHACNQRKAATDVVTDEASGA